MRSIGERLAETRKRKGISLREAADSLKVSVNILDCFENDHFDIGLPEIFVRGFLTNYAKFLEVDPARIRSDYGAYKMGESKLAKRHRRELLGRLDLPDSGSTTEEPSERDSGVEEAAAAWAFPSGPTGTKSAESSSALDTESKVDYSIYWKLRFAAAAVVVAVFVLLVYIIWSVITKPGPDLNPRVVETPAPLSETTETQIIQPAEETILLVASGDVDVLVIEQNTDKQLYRGPLAAGDEVEIAKTGPVTIAFSEGAFLEYEKGGQRFQPKSQGLGRMTVP
ncbi:MAG: hypothetical protein F7B06_01745 [Opitutae bacterium]|nr:hypothetical protein [Opitutae bacterium]MBC9888581.1 hypothetical protein [Opitutae bacterium]